jgi:beta-glucanase (GH16 family)
MRLWPFPWLLLLLSIPPHLLSQKQAGNWVLTFAEEFNGPELDLARWSPHDPLGKAHTFAPEAVALSGGQLHLAAKGIVSTFGTFAQTWGRYEIRCRVAAGSGLSSRFLLLPVQLGTLPAIDVFETRGGAPSTVLFANHWGTEQTERSFSESFRGPDLSTGFHTIAVEWDRDKIAWFLDDKEKFQSVDGIPHQPMYLFLDLIGTGNSSFDIDYIRVYQRP